MKMEHSLKAPATGSVSEFYFKTGELVDGGAELLTFQTAQVIQPKKTNKESSKNVT
jgi:3-methylcrotonyl-CoA carboxylase alpha subunit